MTVINLLKKQSERIIYAEYLRLCEYNLSQAARKLGMNKSNLQRRLKALNMPHKMSNYESKK
jgi:DNA-binding NtrC family response regulator